MDCTNNFCIYWLNFLSKILKILNFTGKMECYQSYPAENIYLPDPHPVNFDPNEKNYMYNTSYSNQNYADLDHVDMEDNEIWTNQNQYLASSDISIQSNLSSSTNSGKNHFPSHAQCGNLRIFLSLRFYVKSILKNIKVL